MLRSLPNGALPRLAETYRRELHARLRKNAHAPRNEKFRKLQGKLLVVEQEIAQRWESLREQGAHSLLSLDF